MEATLSALVRRFKALLTARAAGEGSADPPPADFGDPAAEHAAARTGSAVFDWSGRDRLTLSGGEVLTWWSGMVSNAVLDLSIGQARYGFVLNRQGRIQFDVTYVRLDERTLLLEFSPGLGGQARGLLDRYLFREDVRIEDSTGQWGRLGVLGPRSADVLVGLVGPHVRTLDGGQSIAVRITGRAARLFRGTAAGFDDGWDLLAPREELPAVWDAMAAAVGESGPHPIGAATLNVLRIERGMPWFGTDFDANSLPAETGLLGRAVRFDKGCYVGQEIVARMQSLGEPARRMCGVALEGSDVPPPGTELRAGDARAGVLTSACRSPSAGGTIGLATLGKAFAAAGQALEAAWPSGRSAARVVALPFVPPSG